MVCSCVAYNCNSKSTKNCGVSFHRFPQDPKTREKWIVAVRRKNFVPTVYSRICSRHFTPDSFLIKPNSGLKLLKNDAVPSVFEFPADVGPPLPKKRRVIERKEITEPTVSTSNSANIEENDLINTPRKPKQQSATKYTKSSFNHPFNIKSTPATPTKILLRRKVKLLQQKLKRRDEKISSMKELISLLKKKLNAPERLTEVLENNFSGFPMHLLVNNLSNAKKSKFKNTDTDKMKEFALTIYFYSPKAYRYLRNMQLGLPHPATLRKYLSNFNCSPGFLEEVLIYLRNNVKSNENLKHVNYLVFDSMSLRKQIIYDSKIGKNVGYVDLGNGANVNNEESLASEVLVFQIVSLKGNFKCAIAYFFIDKICADVLSNLVKMAIMKLQDIGVFVENVTFDGASTNIAAVNKLGCKLPSKPYFEIKGISRKIFVMLDACHMLKLARNTLADKRTIETEDGVVDFKYVENLNNRQKTEGLKFANKLSDRHIFYRNRKMNVKVAAQTLSAGVADAIEFLMRKNDPAFDGCQATVRFIKIIDRLFDYFNSRDPHGKGFKKPIKREHVNKDTEFLNECTTYLSTLKIDGVPIMKHARKTFALGFLGNINVIKMLHSRLLDDLNFSYILTYKLSQDHLELFFSCIRSRGGNNNNPNVKQFQWALRKLMFRNSVHAPVGSNCLEFDDYHQAAVLSFHEPHALLNIDEEENTDEFEELCDAVTVIQTSYYKENILYYICGYIVRRIQNKIDCEECKEVLETDISNLSTYTHFTDCVSRGKLVRASGDVMKLIRFLYNLFNVNIVQGKCNTTQLVALACQHFAGQVFKHKLRSSYDDIHEMKLIKLIGALFYKVVGHSYARDKTTAVTSSKLGLRQKLNKMVLFSNV